MRSRLWWFHRVSQQRFSVSPFPIALPVSSDGRRCDAGTPPSPDEFPDGFPHPGTSAASRVRDPERARRPQISWLCSTPLAAILIRAQQQMLQILSLDSLSAAHGRQKLGPRKGSADLFCRSAAFPCPQGTSRGLTEQVRATPAFETLVIPAQAGIQACGAFPVACEVDSRFRGNDCTREHPCLAIDTTTCGRRRNEISARSAPQI